MRKLICILLVVSILLTGCAGREANPVQMYYPGDENRSCQALITEMAQIQKEMDVLRPKTDKFVTNALWATAGVFLIFPFFFMDMKDAERIEYDAYARRYNRLLISAAEKNCDMTGLPSEPELTIQEKLQKAKEEKEAAEAKSKTPEVQL